MSVDLKGYKRGEARSESELMVSLEYGKECLETYTLQGNTAMTNWYQGRCMQILDILGYEDSIGIVHQWENEALKAKEVASDDRVNCPHCQQRVTTHLDGMGDNARVRCDECGKDLNFEPDNEVASEQVMDVTQLPDFDHLIGVTLERMVSEGKIEMKFHNGEPHYGLPQTEEPVQAVCFSAQPVANGAEVPVLEDEPLCDGCHHVRCICDYLAAERAVEGDIFAMKSLGHRNETITWVREGEIKPEEFLPDD